MIKVANQKVINRLILKSLKANRTRNLIAIIAIALTTTLFTTLFTISMGMVQTIETETMRQSGGSSHASLKYLTDEEYEKVKEHPLIKETGYNVLVNMADNEEFLKRHTEIWYSDETGARLSFTGPTTGKMPEAENEIVTDTATLDLLEVPHELGQKVRLQYTIEGKKHSREFVLSGFYESDAASTAGMVLVSRAFIDTELRGVTQNYREDFDATGTIRLDIMFADSANIEEKIQKVITDSGCSLSENDDNYMAYGVNWAYLSTNMGADPETVIGTLLAAILIVFTGYLIIYNIFQISVIKDIRFYGLLKTIGTTPRQLKRIIRGQALLLSVIGIPAGLAIGYLLGVVLLPLVVNVSAYSGHAGVSASPYIFTGAAAFSLITVFISCHSPGRVAAKVSPVDAVRYSGANVNQKRTAKKTIDGGKLDKMALSNLGRDKKKTIIVIISMSLSLILLNSVYTISNGFVMDKYLSKFVKTDFLIGHANYFNVLNGFHSEDDALSESFIDAVSSQAGFEDGGSLYYNLGKSFIHYTGDASVLSNSSLGQEQLQLFGLEDFPLTQLDIVEGELDLNKFKTGKYIIEGLPDDDNGNIIWEEDHYSIGDIVTVTTGSGTHEYEIMAKCRMGYSNHVRYWGDFGFYLPAGEFCSIVTDATVFSYQFNVDDAHTDAMEEFVKDYTENVEPAMDYESKQSYANQFEKLQNMLLTVGGTLSIIIGLIGILNFINSMLTSIIARRQEFAMLQSIGMTGKQLHKLLIYEGLYYALSTIAVSLLFGILFSFVIIKGVVGGLWFFSYQFIIMPLLLAYPILLVLSAIIPYAAYHWVNRQSIVERLREAE